MSIRSPLIRPRRWLPLLALIGLAASGCGEAEAPAEKPGTPAKTASGGGGSKPSTVVVDGSSTVFRISKAAAEGFASKDDSAEVVVNNSGTGGGFGNYIQGEVDVVDASRPAKKDEEEKARAKGYEWTRFLVGYDGITVVANGKNEFLKEMTVDQLKAVWAPGAAVKSWNDINPSWPARKVVLYSPDKNSGTFEFFTEAIVGKAKSQRDDVQANADDNVLVSGVTGDADGLGYFGYAYYEANKERLHAVAVKTDDKAPAVLPSPATILDKSYRPLSRPLYIYVKNSSATTRPEVRKFLGYYLENVRTLAKEGGYVSPTDADVAANAEAAKPLLADR